MAISDDPKLRTLQTELDNCHSDIAEMETVIIQITAENEALRNNNEFIQNSKPGYPFHKITDEGFVAAIKKLVDCVALCVILICVTGYFIAKVIS